MQFRNLFQAPARTASKVSDVLTPCVCRAQMHSAAGRAPFYTDAAAAICTVLCCSWYRARRHASSVSESNPPYLAVLQGTPAEVLNSQTTPGEICISRDRTALRRRALVSRARMSDEATVALPLPGETDRLHGRRSAPDRNDGECRLWNSSERTRHLRRVDLVQRFCDRHLVGAPAGT
jgi:hypothetical protein